MNLPAQKFETYSTFCSNPNCNEPFDLDKATAEIQKSGVVYADCGEVIFQGYSCSDPNCRGLRFVRCDRNNPVFDLGGFIIIPNFNFIGNLDEQVLACKNPENRHVFLKFKFIPAWDDETVSSQDLLNSNPEGELDLSFSPESSYFMTPIEFQERLQSEIETGTIQLRRLYPDIPKFRSLLTCLAHDRITELDDSGLMRAENDGSSAKEFEERNSAWRTLLEEGGGRALNEAVIGLLRDKGVADLDENEIETLIVRELTKYRRKGAQLLREQAKKAGFEETIWKSFEKAFNDILYAVCTELALTPHRKELIGWVNKAEKGKALFVDAPMGLGKTYSIVEAMAENPELSAVIFMPTKKLCEELVFNLKEKITVKNATDCWGIYQNAEVAKDSNGNDIIDQDGFPRLQYRRDWLESEVYYADGINADECPHFDEIIKRYHQNWIKRQDLCHKCLMKNGCRFNSHWIEAPLSRIVVATHHKYDNFHSQSGIRQWYKDGYVKKDENGDIINGEDDKPIKLDGVERNFFIVDEDIVLSQCYQPFSLKYKELQDFLATVRDFVDQFSGTEEINNKIFNFFGRVGLCKTTSFIRPIDQKFRFPKIIREEWEDSNRNLLEVSSKIDEPPELVGNHLDMIEDAIRLGLVVQKYANVHRIYFHNRKSYDLSKMPPHVFFDGTPMKERFLKKKLRKVDLKGEKISVKPLWNFKVWQNRNTELSKTGIDRDREKVKSLLYNLLNVLGPSHKYLILSSKNTKNYLKKFLKQNFPHFDIIPGHYGYLRGINDAKDCDVGIMLGSYMLSDAVEIAMALEFIQKALPKKAISPTYLNFWSWKGSKSRRVYKKKYDIINKFAETFRHSEHRQAMARARYLFHDVDFYVFSKDPVNDFEPYARIEDDKYREDIFPPRAERSDNKYEEVKEKILRLIIREGKKLGELDLHRITGHSRTTIRKHLKKMMEEERVPIVREGMKYRFPRGV